MSDSFHNEEDPDHIDKKTLVARRVARLILSNTEANSTIITRAKLTNTIRDACQAENTGSVKFEQVFQELNVIFGDIYGFKLLGLQPKSNKDKKPGKNSSSGNDHVAGAQATGFVDLKSKAQSFILINALPSPPPRYGNFLLSQCTKPYSERIINEEYMGHDMSIASENTLDNKLSTDLLLVLQGLTSVVIAVVLFSSNNILQQELEQHLAKFGIPTDGLRIPIVDLTFEELIKLLDRKEYIVRIEERSKDGNQETVSYRIGRRTQIEFDKDSLLAMCQELMGLDPAQSSQIQESIELAVGDAYAVV